MAPQPPVNPLGNLLGADKPFDPLARATGFVTPGAQEYVVKGTVLSDAQTKEIRTAQAGVIDVLKTLLPEWARLQSSLAKINSQLQHTSTLGGDYQRLITRRSEVEAQLTALQVGNANDLNIALSGLVAASEEAQKGLRHIIPAGTASFVTQQGKQALATTVAKEGILGGLTASLAAAFPPAVIAAGIIAVITTLVGEITKQFQRNLGTMVSTLGVDSGEFMEAGLALQRGMVRTASLAFSNDDLAKAAAGAMRAGFMSGRVQESLIRDTRMTADQLNTAAGAVIGRMTNLGAALGMTADQSGQLLGTMTQLGMFDYRKVVKGSQSLEATLYEQATQGMGAMSLVSKAFDQGFDPKHSSNILKVTNQFGISTNSALMGMVGLGRGLHDLSWGLSLSSNATDKYLHNMVRSPELLEQAAMRILNIGAKISDEAVVAYQLVSAKGGATGDALNMLMAATRMSPLERLSTELTGLTNLFKGQSPDLLGVAVKQATGDPFLANLAARAVTGADAQSKALLQVLKSGNLEDLERNRLAQATAGAMGIEDMGKYFAEFSDPLKSIMHNVSRLVSQITTTNNTLRSIYEIIEHHGTNIVQGTSLPGRTQVNTAAFS